MVYGGVTRRLVLWFIGDPPSIHYYDLDHPRTGVHALTFQGYSLRCVLKNIAIFPSKSEPETFLFYSLTDGYGAVFKLGSPSIQFSDAVAHSYAFFIRVRDFRQEDSFVYVIVCDAPLGPLPPLVPHDPHQTFPRASARLLCSLPSSRRLTQLSPLSNAHGPVFETDDVGSSQVWRIV